MSNADSQTPSVDSTAPPPHRSLMTYKCVRDPNGVKCGVKIFSAVEWGKLTCSASSPTDYVFIPEQRSESSPVAMLEDDDTPQTDLLIYLPALENIGEYPRYDRRRNTFYSN